MGVGIFCPIAAVIFSSLSVLHPEADWDREGTLLLTTLAWKSHASFLFPSAVGSVAPGRAAVSQWLLFTSEEEAQRAISATPGHSLKLFMLVILFCTQVSMQAIVPF